MLLACLILMTVSTSLHLLENGIQLITVSRFISESDPLTASTVPDVSVPMIATHLLISSHS